MKKSISLIIWVICLEIIGFSSGMITKFSLNDWYLTLNRSPFTPPNIVFSIVWAILYLLIAISGWLLWQKTERLLTAKTCFIIQLLLNWSWTPIFFYFQAPYLALICLLLIILFTLATMVTSCKHSMWSAILLAPYLIWLFFAFYLNAYIVVSS